MHFEYAFGVAYPPSSGKLYPKLNPALGVPIPISLETVWLLTCAPPQPSTTFGPPGCPNVVAI